MATPARSQGSRTSQAHAPSFDILQDGPSLDKMHLHPSSSGEKDVNSLSRAVSELAIENYQNIPPASVALREAPEPKFIKAQIEQHVPRLQRPALSAQTFQPLARDENGDKTPTAAPAAQVPLPAAELPLKRMIHCSLLLSCIGPPLTPCIRSWPYCTFCIGHRQWPGCRTNCV